MPTLKEKTDALALARRRKVAVGRVADATGHLSSAFSNLMER